MFIELFITKIAILNCHRGNLLLLKFEKKLEVFAFRQTFKTKYFMQILNAEKSMICSEFSRKNRPNQKYRTVLQFQKTVLIRNPSYQKPS